MHCPQGNAVPRNAGMGSDERCLLQGILAAAERKSKDVSERVAYATSEGGKLDSRLTHAIDQWQSGLSKTQAAARQLSSLASSVSLGLLPHIAC